MTLKTDEGKPVSVLIAELKQAGIHLSANGDSLSVKAKVSPVPKQHIAALKANKEVILAFFQQQAAEVKQKIASIPTVQPGAIVKATPTQQRLWLLAHEGATTAYNIAVGFEFTPDRGIEFHPESFIAAVNRVTARHSVFNTEFVVQQGELYQRLTDRTPARVSQQTLSKEQAFSDVLTEWADHSFDIEQDDYLYRHGLFCQETAQGDKRWSWIFLCHHIIMDGRSLSVLFNEIAQCYNLTTLHKTGQQVDQSVNDSDTDSSTSVRYIDYADWLAGDESVKQKIADSVDWHVKQLAGVNRGLGAMAENSVSTLQATQALKTKHDIATRFSLSNELSDGIVNAAKTLNVTPFSYLLAAFKWLLSQQTGNHDLATGFPVESRIHADLDKTVGYFANTVAFRSPSSNTQAFAEFVQQVQQQLTATLDKQDATFDQVVARLNDQSGDQQPLISSFFTYQQSGSGLDLQGIRCKKISRLSHQAKFPIGLIADHQAEHIDLVWEFQHDKIADVLQQQLPIRFEFLLQQLVDQPEQSLDQLSSLTPNECEQLLTFNQFGRMSSSRPALLTAIQQHLDTDPDASVVIDADNKHWSRQDFNQHVAAIERIFSDYGVAQGDSVLLLASRSLVQMAAQVAAFRRGIVFIPAAPELPTARLQHIVANCQPRLLLTNQTVEIYANLDLPAVDLTKLSPDSALVSSSIKHDISQEAPAYIVHTSGTTGQPKGIIISRHALTSMINAYLDEEGVRTGESVLMMAGESFDASMLDIWSILAGGATALIPNSTVKQDVMALAEYIQRHHITAGFIPTPYLMACLTSPTLAACFDQGRQFLTGGSQLLLPESTCFKPIILDAYGPSENTIVSTFKRHFPQQITPEYETSIGRPVKGVNVYVVDKDLDLLPPGLIGEIVVSGNNLATGYVNQGALTAEKFVTLPHDSAERAYRTGDMGYINHHNELVFAGRNDDQVQVRGFRVEPSEIVSVLAAHTLVDQAVVLFDNRQQQLCAWVTPELTVEQLATIKQSLVEQLPAYMVPPYLVSRPSFPYTVNDKVDHKALLATVSQLNEELEESTTETSDDLLLTSVIQCFADALQRPFVEIRTDSDFFASGGHSLSALKLVLLINEALSTSLTVAQLMTNPTPAAVKDFIERQTRTTVVGLSDDAKQNGVALTPAMYGLWSLYRASADTSLYNVQAVYQITGTVDVGRLIQTISLVYQNQQVLRSYIRYDDAGQPLLALHQGLERIKSSWLPDVVVLTEEQSLSDWIAQEASRQFTVELEQTATTPLFIARILQQSETNCYVQLNLPHLITDGWSINLIWQQIAAKYSQTKIQIKEQTKALTTDVDFFDVLHGASQVARITDSSTKSNSHQWWVDTFSGYEPQTLRKQFQPSGSGNERFALSAPAQQQIAELARELQTSEFVVTFSLFNWLLATWFNSDDIAVSYPFANRGEVPLLDDEGNETAVNTAAIPGYFVNVLPARCQLTQTSLEELIADMDHQLSSGQQHSNADFIRVVKDANIPLNSGLASPLQQFVFAWLEGLTEPEQLSVSNTSEAKQSNTRLLSSNELLAQRGETPQAKFPLMLSAYPVEPLTGNDADLAEKADSSQLMLSWEYQTEWFTDQDIASLHQAFDALISGITSSNQSLNTLNRSLCPESSVQIPPSYQTVVHHFEHIVEITPNKIALIAGDVSRPGETNTYQQLNEAANIVAHWLLQQHDAETDSSSRGLDGQVVGITARKTIEQIVAILAIAKAGGVYLPVAADTDAKQLDHMIKQTGLKLCLLAENDHPEILLERLNTVHVSALTQTDSSLNRRLTTNPAISISSEQGLYINYSSGTTGIPKGILCTHQGVSRLVVDSNVADLNHDTVMLSAAPATFDAFTLECFGPLLNGGQLVLASETLSPDYLRQVVTDYHINTGWFTAGLFNTLVEISPELFDGYSTLLVGGDVVSPAHVAAVYRANSSITLINGYGPTENTTFTCSYLIPRELNESQPLPIGTAISGTDIVVVDRHGMPLPNGFIGELIATGAGLAIGYIGNDALTQQVFIPVSLSQQTVRGYKTGDLVYQDQQGQLHYLGRGDSQVKVNGYRVEPEGIDQVIRQHPAVQACKTIATKTAGRGQLVSFFVNNESSQPATSDSLKHWASAMLPGWMVPGRFVAVEQIPLGQSGKADVKALKAQLTTAQNHPNNVQLTQDEQALATGWQELLPAGTEVQSSSDSFYQLGGDSLLILKLQQLIASQFSIKLSLAMLIKHHTLAEQAALISEQQITPDGNDVTTGNDDLTETPSDQPFYATAEQSRLWLIQQQQTSNQYHIPLAFTFDDETVGLRDITQAWQTVLADNPLLRSFIAESPDVVSQTSSRDGLPIVQCTPQSVADWSPSTITINPDEALAHQVHDALDDLNRTAIQLSQEWPLRLKLLLAGNQVHAMVLVVHHIAFDGGSLQPLIQQLDAALVGKRWQGGEFSRYASWQQSQHAQTIQQDALAYWKNRLTGVEDYTRLPPCQVANNTDDNQQQAALIEHPVSVEHWQTLNAVAKGLSVSRFTLWFEIVAATVAQLLDRDEVTIATPAANRLDQRFQHNIGFYANTLLLRYQIDMKQSLIQQLQPRQQTLADDLNQQSVSMAALVRAGIANSEAGMNPLTDILFSLSEQQHYLMDGKSLTVTTGENQTAKYGLSITLSARSDGAVWQVEYDRNQYSSSLIATLLQSLNLITGQIAERPNLPLTALSLTADAPSITPVDDNNHSVTSVLQKILMQGTNRANASALKTDSQSYCYNELLTAARRRARYLIKHGVKPDSRVAVLLERTHELPITLLGIWLAGAAYVPLDPSYPEERTRYIVDHAKPDAIIVEPELHYLIEQNDSSIAVLDLAAETDNNEVELPDIESLASQLDRLAYIIYTSGSTGTPKGVAINHRAVSWLSEWAGNTWSIEDVKTVFSGTSVCFDLSVYELFVTWSLGGCVFFAENNLALIDQMSCQSITMINTVPSVLAEVIKHQPLVHSIKAVNLAGEPLPKTLAADIMSQAPQARLFNLYGPSEDTTYSTAWQVKPDHDILIGKPVNGTQAWVVDRFDRPLPPEFPGELTLFGEGLAQGYWQAPELTEERFVINSVSRQRCYKTGDQVRLTTTGELEYLGRIDNQVKLRGFRIEPGELDDVLLRHQHVAEACTVVVGSGEQAELISFVVIDAARSTASADSTEVSSLNTELMTLLSSYVPGYMLPAAIISIDAMPLSPSGKQDRKALAARYQAETANSDQTRLSDEWSGLSDTERWLAEQFSTILKRPPQLTMGFVAQGGNSLSATTLLAEIKQHWQVDISFQMFFENNTIEGLAQVIDAEPEQSEEDDDLLIF